MIADIGESLDDGRNGGIHRRRVIVALHFPHNARAVQRLSLPGNQILAAQGSL